MSRATIMAVVNQKGGTGKTTTCENLGIGLANEGKRVLLVDTDPQASLTIALGHPRPDDLPVTLTDLMAKVMQDQPIAPKEGILSHEEGVDLVPANITLSGMEVSLVNAMSRETVLRQVLDALKFQYDYILLDCMPSLGMLTVNALAASDQVLIPVQANYLSAKGLEQLLQTVNKVKRQINAVDRKVSRVRIPNSPPKKPSHIKALRPYDWAFLFANLPLLHMIFGKKSCSPSDGLCFRQSQDIVHDVCGRKLGLRVHDSPAPRQSPMCKTQICRLDKSRKTFFQIQAESDRDNIQKKNGVLVPVVIL